MSYQDPLRETLDTLKARLGETGTLVERLRSRGLELGELEAGLGTIRSQYEIIDAAWVQAERERGELQTTLHELSRAMDAVLGALGALEKTLQAREHPGA